MCPFFWAKQDKINRVTRFLGFRDFEGIGLIQHPDGKMPS